MALTAKQQRFVDEYLIDLNATKAAVRAGYSEKTARQAGAENLSKPVIAQAIEKAIQARSARVEIDQDWVLKRWVEIADTDVRELVQNIRVACGECWSDDYREDINPECHACHGRGKGMVIISDTRNLSAGAARLYAGVQKGKEGYKVLVRNQDAALENIARHLGMFKDSLELKGGINVTISQDDAAL